MSTLCINKSAPNYKLLRDRYGDVLAEQIVRLVTRKKGIKNDFYIPNIKETKEYIRDSSIAPVERITNLFKTNSFVSQRVILDFLQGVLSVDSNTIYIIKGWDNSFINAEFLNKTEILDPNLRVMTELQRRFPEVFKIIPTRNSKVFKVEITPFQEGTQMSLFSTRNLESETTSKQVLNPPQAEVQELDSPQEEQEINVSSEETFEEQNIPEDIKETITAIEKVVDEALQQQPELFSTTEEQLEETKDLEQLPSDTLSTKETLRQYEQELSQQLSRITEGVSETDSRPPGVSDSTTTDSLPFESVYTDSQGRMGDSEFNTPRERVESDILQGYRVATALANHIYQGQFSSVLSLIRRLTKDTGLRFEVIKSSGLAAFSYSSEQNVVFINPIAFRDDLRLNASPETALNYYGAALMEELIHAISYRVSTQKERETIFKELSSEERQGIQQYYFAELSQGRDRALNDNQVVIEYLRQVVQKQLAGNTTEEFRNDFSKLKPTEKSVLNKILDFLLETFNLKPKNSTTVAKVEAIKAYINGDNIQLSLDFNTGIDGSPRNIESSGIKPGVQELFESNLELANEVYEALGFEIPTTKLQGKKFDYGEPTFFDIATELTSGERSNLPSSILINKLLQGEFLPTIKKSQIILGLSESGVWKPDLKKIEASGENKSTLAKKVGHELLHSVTNNIILSYQNLKGVIDFNDKYNKDFIKQGYIKPVNLTKSQVEALDNLVRIRNKVVAYIEQNKDKIQKQDRGFGTYDYFIRTNYTESETDLHEFISEVFTNPELISILKEIPTEGKKSNLFKDFVEAIAKILGFTNTSILEDVIAYSEEAFFAQPQITPQQKQQAQQLYSQYLDSIGVTDIAYHHSEEDISEFTSSSERYFQKELKKKNRYIPKLDDIVFLVKKPLTEEFMSKRKFIGSWGLKTPKTLQFNAGEKIGEGVHPGIDEGIFAGIEGNYDAIDFGRIRDNKTWSEVIAITNPKNAIKLGSKQDIENFAKFVKNSELGNVRDMENYMNSKSVDYIMGKLIQSGKIEKRC